MPCRFSDDQIRKIKCNQVDCRRVGGEGCVGCLGSSKKQSVLCRIARTFGIQQRLSTVYPWPNCLRPAPIHKPQSHQSLHTPLPAGSTLAASSGAASDSAVSGLRLFRLQPQRLALPLQAQGPPLPLRALGPPHRKGSLLVLFVWIGWSMLLFLFKLRRFLWHDAVAILAEEGAGFNVLTGCCQHGIPLRTWRAASRSLRICSAVLCGTRNACILQSVMVHSASAKTVLSLSVSLLIH